MEKILKIILVLIVFIATVFAQQTPYIKEIPKTQEGVITYIQFNVCNLGKAKMEESLSIDGKKIPVLRYIAKLLQNASIIAIQEVSTKDWGAKAVAQLQEELNLTGAKWDYFVSDPTTGEGTERFAILWKTSTVTYMARGESGLVTALEKEIGREPMHTVFKINEKRLHIYNFHLVPTAKKPENEVKILASNPKKFNLTNTILSGDFNLPHKKLDLYFEKKLKLRHLIEGKTSLGRKESYLSQEYDNVYVTKNLDVIQCAILDFVQAVGNLEEARKISDHLPVVLWLKIK